MKSMEIAAKENADRLTRIERAMATYQGDPDVGSISAMPVLIDFEADWREYRHYKRGEEHVFDSSIEKGQKDDSIYEQELKTSCLSAYAILDDFQNVKTPLDALDFLNKTGQFSLLDYRFTWSYFKRWQRFAYLVQEHNLLASAMREDQWSGECGEALKALTGNHPSTFFDGSELQPTGGREEVERRARWMFENAERVQENTRIVEEERGKLCAWFRQPPDNACSIEWIPKTAEDCQMIDAQVAKGAMAEFLLPQEAMRPVLFIRPTYTLEAIAAAIYAERIEGVEYRACEVCSELFEVGTRADKKYCSRERCKNTAHQRRMRAKRAIAQKNRAIQTGSEA